MRHILSALLLVVLLCACKKNKSTLPIPVDPANTLEHRILGTWYLSRATDSLFFDSTWHAMGVNDTIFARYYYPRTANVVFIDSSMPGFLGYLKGEDAIYLNAPSQYFQFITDTVDTKFNTLHDMYWRCDETNMTLTELEDGFPYSIVTLDSTHILLINITIRPNSFNDHLYLYLTK